ncbi:glycosyltransferase involved in cell wall biosynthesis [Mesonia algae]|uniref:Glycosyltransferase involved in cell wall biosynthesis n=1 Tax=Mesonia algae TaxID=213248 RepID=A0A2W7HYQ8_9FLAO|nr:glycosyltransferase family 4 protein [Mesonia algae]PZW39069.1 glycosyltransferase involved in cell wall biosynthesis [Mesonia algae]
MKAKKIKVLFTIPNFKTAGSQYVLLSLYKEIDYSIFDPYIAVEKFPDVKPAAIPDDRFLFFPKGKGFWQEVFSMSSTLRKLKIDIIHSWDYKSTSLEALAARLSFIPYLYTKKNDAWSKRWFLKTLLSNHIAYDHPKMKVKFFNHFLFNNKLSFIPHGVNENIFYAKKRIQASSIIKLGCIGNINSNKNQLFLLEAMNFLPKNIHLFLYGKTEQDYFKQLKNFISSHQLEERIHFKGFVSNQNLPKVLNGIDVFILPSKKEGLPVSILEALSCQVPVLASDSGGGTSYIASKGEGIKVFDILDMDGFLQLIRPLLSDSNLRKELGESGRVLIEENFTLDKEIKSYEKLYLQLTK